MPRSKRNPLPKIKYLDRVDEFRRDALLAFCRENDIVFKDLNLLNRALSHKSFTNELNISHNEQYEKLEFLGDSVLGLIINENLFKIFPDYEEGELAKIKSAVVSEQSLAEIAMEINLASVILMSKGEEQSSGAKRPSLLADVLESVIGALYIDQGLPAVRKFIIRHFESKIRAMSKEESVGDYKSYFQELVQKELGERPDYVLLKSSGPEHSKTFRVAVYVRKKELGVGIGKSKKEAEQKAAEIASKKFIAKKDIPKKTRTNKSSRSIDKKKKINNNNKVIKYKMNDFVPDEKIMDPVEWAAQETFSSVRIRKRKR